MTSAPSDLDVLAAAGDRFGQECRLVADRWDLPTPCPDWDVGQLVDHVVGGNRFTTGILAGQPADDAMSATMASFETDAGEGVGRTEAAARSLREQLEAFGRAGALERRCHHVAGELAGAQVLRLRVHDLIVHGWDLAQALHPPAAVPPDLVRWAVAELSGPASLTAGHFAIAPADLAGGPGPDQGRALLAAFGRPV